MTGNTFAVPDRLDGLLVEEAGRLHGACDERGAQPSFPSGSANAIAKSLELRIERCWWRTPVVRVPRIHVPEDVMRAQGMRHGVVAADPQLRRTKHQLIVREARIIDIDEFV